MLENLNKLINVGIVSSVDYEKATVRVNHLDRDVVSGPLSVLQPRTQGNKGYSMPEIGEQVLCLFMPQNRFIDGFVMGSIYNKQDVPQGAKGLKSFSWSDGSYVKYDENSKKMEVKSVGEVSIEAGTIVRINAQDLEANIGGSVNIVAQGNLKLVGGGGEMELTGGSARFNNELRCVDVVTDRGSHNSHTHTGNMNQPTSPPL